MNETQVKKKDSTKPARKNKRKTRLLRWIGIPLAVIVTLYVMVRFVYPLWLQYSLPEDSPRIAFSLDNSIIGMIGITDVTYQRVIAAAGGRLIKLRPDAVEASEITVEKLEEMLEEEKFDAVLLAGGGDIDPDIYGGEPGDTMLLHRLRDEFEMALFSAARELNLPILGICRGCQIINVAMGGTVRNLRREKEFKKAHFTLRGHPVEIVKDSRLAKIFGVTQLPRAISLHGQAVDKLGTDVEAVAFGPKNITEAIEVNKADKDEWIIGLQFHPELTFDKKVQQRIFREFVAKARKTHQSQK
ncbi:MAG: gamma-glutamyl-gamma-aminobutyrate hydrolase family protein [Sedimentisphaerales bacterium]